MTRPSLAASASSWIPVGTVDDIPRRGSRVVETDRGPIAVFRTADDELHAVDNRCPHRGGPLSAGIVHGDKVTCPLHAWVIDLASGSASAPDVGCVVRYPVSRDGDQVLLSLSPLAEGA